jgi:hypothetical protein
MYRDALRGIGLARPAAAAGLGDVELHRAPASREAAVHVRPVVPALTARPFGCLLSSAQCTKPNDLPAASLSRSGTCVTTCASGKANPAPPSLPAGDGPRLDGRGGFLPVRGRRPVEADHYRHCPDWRGYGLTGSPGRADNYWFPTTWPTSTSCSITTWATSPSTWSATAWAAISPCCMPASRPQRIRRLVNLEGFGMPASQPAQAPGRYAKWMDELKGFPSRRTGTEVLRQRGGRGRPPDENQPAPAPGQGRLAGAPLGAPGCRWPLAILGDAAHKIINAQLYRVDEVLADLPPHHGPPCRGSQRRQPGHAGGRANTAWPSTTSACKQVSDLQVGGDPDAGHMLHHDQPEQLATLIEGFLG